MLPDIDGFEVCRRIRATGSKMGILMLSAKSQEMDKITGLMTGADDYVTRTPRTCSQAGRSCCTCARARSTKTANTSA